MTVHERQIELVLLGSRLLDALARRDYTQARALAPFILPDALSDEAIELFAWRRDQLVADPAWEPWLLRAIVLRDEARMVGYANFHGPRGVNDAGEPNAVSIGYAIFPEFRGRGLATQAAEALLAWAGREHSVTHFVCGVRPDNAASIRVLQKLGFTRTEMLVEDEVIFELRRA